MQGFLTDVARAILTNGLRAILPERVLREHQRSSQIFLEMHMGKNDFLMMLFQLYPFHRSLSLLYKKNLVCIRV